MAARYRKLAALPMVVSSLMAQEKIVVRSPDGVPISILKTGSGPALVLVHGSASFSSSWGASLPALASHFTVYAMDRRGRPPSGDAETYSMKAETYDIAAVVEAVAGESVTLVAHSYGAVVAVAAAANGDLPKKVARLILYEPPTYVGETQESTRMRAELNAAWEAGDRDQVVSLFLTRVLGLPAATLAGMRASPVWPVMTGMAHTMHRESQAVASFKVPVEDLGKWKIPTTMLLGSQSPQQTGDGTRLICDAMPNCKLVILEGQGHLAPQLAPALFVSKVLDAVNAH